MSRPKTRAEWAEFRHAIENGLIWAENEGEGECDREEAMATLDALIAIASTLGNLVPLMEWAQQAAAFEPEIEAARKALDAFLPTADDVLGILGSEPGS